MFGLPVLFRQADFYLVLFLKCRIIKPIETDQKEA